MKKSYLSVAIVSTVLFLGTNGTVEAIAQQIQTSPEALVAVKDAMASLSTLTAQVDQQKSQTITAIQQLNTQLHTLRDNLQKEVGDLIGKKVKLRGINPAVVQMKTDAEAKITAAQNAIQMINKLIPCIQPFLTCIQ